MAKATLEYNQQKSSPSFEKGEILQRKDSNPHEELIVMVVGMGSTPTTFAAVGLYSGDDFGNEAMGDTASNFIKDRYELFQGKITLEND